MTPIQTKSKELQAEILGENYYWAEYCRTLSDWDLTFSDIDDGQILDEVLIQFWNLFWLELPETKEIRTPTFFKLCNIAEEIFS